MIAAKKALAALEAAGKAATPMPWYAVGRLSEEEVLQIGGCEPHVCDDNGSTIAETTTEKNANLIALAVNLSSPLAAVARAAMEYRKGDGCEGVLWAALDALEAAAEGR